MNLPPFIKPGDTIGITAPSFGCTTEPYKSRLKEAVRQLKDRGYKIKIGRTVSMDNGKGISTDPKTAARELVKFYLDPKINCIISAGGGECMCETMSFIDFEKLKASPAKWFMGYSDNTNFILPLLTVADTPAIYGQCISGFGKPWEQSEVQALNLLEGKSLKVHGYEKFQDPLYGTEAKKTDPLSPYILTDEKKLKCFVPAPGKTLVQTRRKISFEGTLAGGCLDVLANLAGTKFDNVSEFVANQKKVIWVLEDCDGNPMEIRRCMWHLKECGWFKNASGFLIGRPLAAWQEKCFGVDQYNAVTDILRELKVPVIMDCDIGHIAPAVPLIMGSNAQVKVQKNNFEIEMKL